MKSRIVFIFICTIFLLGSVYLGVRLFYGGSNGSNEVGSSVANANRPSAPTKHSELRLSHSTNGADENAAHSPKEAGSTASIKSQAEIENNVTNLLQIYEQGQDEEFLRRLNELIAANPNVKEYVALLGDYHYNEQNWAEASKSVDKLIALDPTNLFAKTTKGELDAILGKPDRALTTFENVIQTDPNNREALYGLLSSYTMMDRGPEGEKWIESYAKANPTASNAALVWADVLGARGDFEGRKAWLQTALTQNQNSPQLYEAAGLDAARDGNSELAFKMFEASIANNRDKQGILSTYQHMTQTALTAGNFDLALHFVDEQRNHGADANQMATMEEAIKAQRAESLARKQ